MPEVGLEPTRAVTVTHRIWGPPCSRTGAGYLQEEPSLLFVADALGTIEAEDQAFGPDVALKEGGIIPLTQHPRASILLRDVQMIRHLT